MKYFKKYAIYYIYVIPQKKIYNPGTKLTQMFELKYTHK